VIRASGRVSAGGAVEGDLRYIALILHSRDALFEGRVRGVGDSAFCGFDRCCFAPKPGMRIVRKMETAYMHGAAQTSE
jgi:hypothetical protein